MEPAPGQSGEHAPAQVVYLAIEAQEAVAGIWAWILESAPMSIGHRHRARLGHVHGGRTGMVMPSVSARSVADALESQALLRAAPGHLENLAQNGGNEQEVGPMSKTKPFMRMAPLRPPTPAFFS